MQVKLVVTNRLFCTSFLHLETFVARKKNNMDKILFDLLYGKLYPWQQQHLPPSAANSIPGSNKLNPGGSKLKPCVLANQHCSVHCTVLHCTAYCTDSVEDSVEIVGMMTDLVSLVSAASTAGC